MLIDDKFIYLSLPRCASTAFHISCIKNGLSVKNANYIYDTPITEDLKSLDNMELVYKIKHVHEQIVNIKSEFGYEYPVISVRRNKYERFVSYFNHVIGELYRIGEMDLYNNFKDIDTKYLMSFQKEDVVDRNSIKNYISKFLDGIGIKDYNHKLNNLFMPIFAPLSFYHSNHNDIIWFEFDKLYELEKWVSDKCGVDFKLEKFGSSKEYQSKIIIDDYFKERYESIYGTYEVFKKEKSII